MSALLKNRGFEAQAANGLRTTVQNIPSATRRDHVKVRPLGHGISRFRHTKNCREGRNMPVAAGLALADGRAQSSVACWPRGCIRAGLSSEIPMNVLDTRPDVDANWRTQQFEGAIESATRQ